MTYIFDIDGTLSNCSHRLHYVLPPEGTRAEITDHGIEFDWDGPDWDSFYKECINDTPVLPVVKLAQSLISAGHDILFITGRPERCRKETWEWLETQGLTKHKPLLYMCADDDHRQDCVYKKEVYEKEIVSHYTIDGVFEDRTQCVNMWRNLGLICYQVADGNY